MTTWSSYSCYVKNQKVPQWLYPKEIFEQLQVKSNFRVKYRQFVEQGIDKEIVEFYSKKISYRIWAANRFEIGRIANGIPTNWPYQRKHL
jgi:hypothetical protein